MSTVKRWPNEPHTFTNEDGRQIWHEGYEYKKCKNCSVEFLVGKGVASEYNFCQSCEMKLGRSK